MMSKKKAGQKAVDERRFSRLVVDGAKQTPSRAMLRAMGFQDGDFHKPQIGVSASEKADLFHGTASRFYRLGT